MENGGIQFEIPDFDEITDEGMRMLLEKTVKKNGIWRVHKSDADCIFPSDFHAHRVDEAETLDVYTGQVYCSKKKVALHKMPKKVMKYIHAQLAKSKEPEFVEKCAKKSQFSFL